MISLLGEMKKTLKYPLTCFLEFIEKYTHHHDSKTFRANAVKTMPWQLVPVVPEKNGPCGHNGYACDATFSKCCPIVNTVDTQYQIGPAIGGLCPIGYVAIYGLPKDTSGNGTCIDLRSSDE